MAMIDIQKNTVGQTIFYLTTKTASLVLLVTDSGIVLTPYWGGRIASQDISYVLNEITRASYLADADGRKDFKLEQLPQIYPSYGYTDLRGPAFAFLYADGCNGVQREHNKKLNNGLPILHKVPPKRDYGRYFCIMAEKGGTSHGGLTEKLSPFFHAKKQEVNAYGR